MRVTVRLFARLRDIAGANELVKDVPAGARVADVWRQLVDDYPDFSGYERAISSAVNADYARMSDVISEDDEIAFLPPVSGG